MKFLQADPRQLSQPKSDELAQFFASDSYQTLVLMAKSHMVERASALAENVSEYPVEGLTGSEITIGARDHVKVISRYSIFLEVLEEIQTISKNQPVIYDKITLIP